MWHLVTFPKGQVVKTHRIYLHTKNDYKAYEIQMVILKHDDRRKCFFNWNNLKLALDDVI